MLKTTTSLPIYRNLYCGMCEAFQSVPHRKRIPEIVNKRVIYTIKCPSKDKRVTDEESVCELFELERYIWCDESCCRMQIPICVHRQIIRTDECKNCGKGKDIMRYMRRKRPIVLAPPTNGERTLLRKRS